MNESLELINLQLGDELSQQLSSKPLRIAEKIDYPLEEKYCDRPLICPPREDSAMDTVDTGFGDENILRKECKKPKYKQHLCKDNYLGEFEAATEKQLARFNLGVYSKEEVDNLIEDIVHNSDNQYATKTEVEQMLAELDFVDSSLKSTANYEIPETLFKL